VAGKRSKVERLVLAGTATIRSADAMHARLARCLRRHSNIEIDCGGVTEVDLILVQLLLAVRKSARRDGKTVVLSAPASGALREAHTHGGFLPSVAGNSGGDNAFWLDGKQAR
jgi:ABC-type transporter Mla MlaB component